MATDWFEAIDAYCERTDATLWSEPLNALSNLAFIAAFAASVYCYRRYREEAGQHRWELVLLLGLLCAIGIGSFLFHTFATRWALVADVGPITLFQFAYLGIFCWHMLAQRARATGCDSAQRCAGCSSSCRATTAGTCGAA